MKITGHRLVFVYFRERKLKAGWFQTLFLQYNSSPEEIVCHVRQSM